LRIGDLEAPRQKLEQMPSFCWRLFLIGLMRQSAQLAIPAG